MVTVVIVTHNMQQAQRVSDLCAFFLAEENEPGYVVEKGPTRRCSHRPTTSAPSTTSRVASGDRRVVAGVSCRDSARGSRRCRCGRVLLFALTPPASATPSAVNGAGSTYAALAMQQWVADAQTQGLQVNYTPIGSPRRPDRVRTGADRLRRYRGRVRLVAGGQRQPVAWLPVRPRRRRSGRDHVPRRRTRPGDKVDYLHLSRETIARIFMGDICRWSDPAITADNKGLGAAEPADHRGLPRWPVGHDRPVLRLRRSTPIRLCSRSGQPRTRSRPTSASSSSTRPRASRCTTLAFNGSDQIAQHIASGQGLWSIGYDEFGYAKTYHVPTAWVQNQSGQYQLPVRAEHLGRARGRQAATRPQPGLSRRLRQRATRSRTRSRPTATSSPSARSAPDRATCKGNYSNSGVTETFAKWLRYIACDGQVNMATIGYSPLPPNLSQEIANSIARMKGKGAKPEHLTAANCANPRFKGELGAGSGAPQDPLKSVGSLAGSSSGPSGSSGPVGGRATRRSPARTASRPLGRTPGPPVWPVPSSRPAGAAASGATRSPASTTGLSVRYPCSCRSCSSWAWWRCLRCCSAASVAERRDRWSWCDDKVCWPALRSSSAVCAARVERSPQGETTEPDRGEHGRGPMVAVSCIRL